MTRRARDMTGTQVRPFLCLEVTFERNPAMREDVCIIASIPGRESVVEHRWRIHGYLPTEAQVSDLSAYTAKLVTDATVMFLGAQKTLPLD